MLAKDPFLASTTFLTNINIRFFQSVSYSIFNHRQNSQSIQQQCSLCCSFVCFSLATGRWNALQYIFRNQTKSEFYGPYFQNMLFLVIMVRYTYFTCSGNVFLHLFLQEIHRKVAVQVWICKVSDENDQNLHHGCFRNLSYF